MISGKEAAMSLLNYCKPSVNATERRRAIEFEAYLLAERDHFANTQESYWLHAEREYDTARQADLDKIVWQKILYQVGAGG